MINMSAITITSMGLLNDLSGAGRFIASTGKGALREIGKGSRTVKRLAGTVDKATGGAAGMAFEASKSMPVVGAVSTNIGKGLDMADKYSGLGIKAIEMGERAGKTRSVGGAMSLAQDAKGLAKQFRP